MTETTNDSELSLVEAFEAALEVHPESLSSHQAEVFPDRPQMRQRVKAMVENHREAEAAFPTAGGNIGLDQFALPARIGEYDIAGVIGQGGMGMVYLGHREQDDLKQTVAIKVDASPIGSLEAQRRFQSERAILAALNHPFVAQVFDWGTTEDGRSYQVMEFVDGLPIDEFVTAQALNQQQILELVQKVCTAVQSAHRNLVFHRDIKPGNVLITADGLPKLIDFGIAKHLDNNELTIVGQISFTPAYASPEQIRGEQLTTATDVNSLGVLLYKLVCGSLPYDLSQLSWREAQDFVHENIAEFPRSLDIDLQNVVAKALQSDLERRYGTIGELAEDLENLLANRPVKARADTVGYRVSKFVRRNAALTGAFAAVLLSVSIALAVSVTQTQRAQAQLHRAEVVTKFLSDLIVSPSPSNEASYQLQPDATVVDILGAAEKALAVDSDIAWDVRVELMNSISHSLMWLDEPDRALAVQANNLALAERHKDLSDEAYTTYLHALAYMGEAHENAGEFTQAIEVFSQADKLAQAFDLKMDLRWLNQLNNFAYTLARAQRWSQAHAVQHRVLQYAPEVLGSEEHPSFVLIRKNYGEMQLELGQVEAADKTIEQSLNLFERLGEADKDWFAWIMTSRVLANIRVAQGRIQEAIAVHDRIAAKQGLTFSYAEQEQLMDRVHAARLRISQQDNTAAQIDIIAQVMRDVEEFLEAPETWPIHLAYAVSLRVQGRYAEGLTAVGTALQLAEVHGATRSEILQIHEELTTLKSQEVVTGSD